MNTKYSFKNEQQEDDDDEEDEQDESEENNSENNEDTDKEKKMLKLSPHLQKIARMVTTTMTLKKQRHHTYIGHT